MATRPLSAAFRRQNEARWGVVAAAALPFLFLHAKFQPGLSLPLGATGVELRLSDLAVLVVLAAGLAAGRRDGFGALAPARLLWLAAGAFAVWLVAASLYGSAVLEGFPTADSAVTAAKFVEYALLAPAVALVLRSRDELRPVASVLVAWSAAATTVGLLQLAGLNLFDVSEPGRQMSFLGHHDFAALSGAALLLGLAVLVLEGGRRRLAIAAGAIGMVLAAPLAGLLGLALALAALLLLARMIRPYPSRRAVAAVLVALSVGLGTVGLRSETLTDFFRFLSDDEPASGIESYSQRTLLAYIGFRIFADHPVVGVGLRGSEEPAAFEPYLDDARRRFPETVAEAFPSADRRYGVQSLYVQVLADLGLVGFALLLALLAAALALAWRARCTAAGVLGLLWLLLAIGLWSAQGLVAGLPLGALTWIALGLVAAGAREEACA